MTREEIIDGLEIYTVGRLNKDRVHITVEELQDFIDAIKALEQQPTDAVDRVTIKEYLESFGNVKTEQEPCEDCISRQKLLKAIATLDKFGCDADKKLVRYTDHYMPYISYYDVVSCIELAWPVTPQPKMGKWVKHDTGHSIYYDCSLCNCVAPCTETRDKILWKLTNYCPDCGAKMSEVKE